MRDDKSHIHTWLPPGEAIIAFGISSEDLEAAVREGRVRHGTKIDDLGNRFVYLNAEDLQDCFDPRRDNTEIDYPSDNNSYRDIGVGFTTGVASGLTVDFVLSRLKSNELRHSMRDSYEMNVAERIESSRKLAIKENYYKTNYYKLHINIDRYHYNLGKSFFENAKGRKIDFVNEKQLYILSFSLGRDYFTKKVIDNYIAKLDIDIEEKLAEEYFENYKRYGFIEIEVFMEKFLFDYLKNGRSTLHGYGKTFAFCAATGLNYLIKRYKI